MDAIHHSAEKIDIPRVMSKKESHSWGLKLPRVDELVDDAEARRYAKKKFNELQTSREAKGKATLYKKRALRKPKW